jgi:hypothetical protein
MPNVLKVQLVMLNFSTKKKKRKKHKNKKQKLKKKKQMTDTRTANFISPEGTYNSKLAFRERKKKSLS